MENIRTEFEAEYERQISTCRCVAEKHEAEIFFAAGYKAATEATRGGEKSGEKSGVWQFYHEGEWFVGMNKLNHRENTEALGCPVRDLYTHTSAPVVPKDLRLLLSQGSQLYGVKLTQEQCRTLINATSESD